MKAMKTKLRLYLWSMFWKCIWILSAISPKLASKMLFRVIMKQKLNLNQPKTLNEKIMWLKLNTYKNNPLVTKCADKLRVRRYVKESGIGNTLVPLFHKWDSTNDINWDALPNSFVIKCNHGCGYNILCPDKEELDVSATIDQLDKWMNTAYWRIQAEINYRHIRPRILCEEYLVVDDNGNPPDDYKVYCFNGQARYILVCTERRIKPKFYFFTERWELARINYDGLEASDDFSLPKPEHLENMLEYSAILSKPFPFVRVDFYVSKSKLYFGEMTFTPSAGLDHDRLPETDKMFGDMLKI